MNNTELITKITELVLENENLRNQVNLIQSMKNDEFEQPTEINDITRRLADFGKDELFEKTTYSWKEVKARYVENDEGELTNDIKVTTYEHFKKELLQKNLIPTWMSSDMYWTLMEDYYKKRYEKEKEQAIKELKNEQD